MNGDTLRSGFTAVKENSGTPLGRDGEISAMLEQDMTVREAAALMIRNWNLPGEDDIEHEAGHIVLALATLYPEASEGLPYQGDFEAENIVFTIEEYIRQTMQVDHHSPPLDKDVFVDGVISEYQDSAYQGNLNRTLLWAMNYVGGDDPERVRYATNYDDDTLKRAAMNAGIGVDENAYLQQWNIRVPGLDEPFFFMADDVRYLPDEIEGGTGFQPFLKPDRNRIAAIYDRIAPALHLIGENIIHAQQTHGDTPIMDAMHDAIGHIRISALVDAMHSPRALALSVESDLDQRGYHA